jgi:hypothetical protein
MSVTIVTRPQWGSQFSNTARNAPLSGRRFWVSHWPGSSGRVADEQATVRAIERQHANQGWSARPGYNFLIGMSGTIYEGCGRDREGVHCPGRNVDGFGVCFLQGMSEAFTAAAQTSGRALYDQLCRDTGRTLTQGWHGLYFATGCPGTAVQNWTAAGMKAPGGQPTPPEPPTNPIPPPVRSDAMFIRNASKVYQLIYDGARSYWREIPNGLIQNIPSDWIMNDPNGAWLALWRVGAGG